MTFRDCIAACATVQYLGVNQLQQINKGRCISADGHKKQFHILSFIARYQTSNNEGILQTLPSGQDL